MRTFTTPEGWVIDWAIRQRMAPVMTRMIEYMEANTAPISEAALAAAVYADRSTVGRYLRDLHDARIFRIAAWNTCRPGDYQRLWSMSSGQPDVAKPIKPPASISSRDHRAKIQALFGRGAYKVLQSRKFGGADVVIRDGLVLYRRGEGVNYAAAERVKENRKWERLV